MSDLRSVIVRGATLVASFGIVWILIATGVIGAFYQTVFATICVNIILGVSLNLITGFTGQFSLGHAGFMALGAYTTALMVMKFPSIWGFLAGLLLGALVAAAMGVLIGLPTLRLKGDYLAIATLGMAEIIRVLFLNFKFTNGAAGLYLPGRFANWMWLFAFATVSVILIANFLRSAPGRNAIAVREDEIAAASIGVNVVKAKTLAFVVGAFFGGLAGGLFASYFYFIAPQQFGFLKSVAILVIVVLGGLGSLTGSVIAAIALTIIQTSLQAFPTVQMIIYALILVLVMIFRPQGLMGDRELSSLVFSRVLPGRRGGTGPPEATAPQKSPAVAVAEEAAS